MNVADFIVNFLAKRDVKFVFMITGGQAMFLNDAVFREKEITPIFTRHEQAAGMAAEAFGRASGRLGVAMVTAGPGALNLINGVVGAWADSSPMMVISGQSAFSNVTYMQKSKIRQLGLQGIEISSMVKPITKFFKTVDDPSKIQNYLQEAFFKATTGRPGPVWIEVPLNIQGMEVPFKLLDSFEKKEVQKESGIKSKILRSLKLLYESERPLILLGQGVKLSKAEREAEEFVKRVNAPVITTRLGIDLIETNNPLFAGRPGLYPDRAANIAVQNSDLIICVGARLDAGIVGYDAKDWGRNAKKIVVDIDEKELLKPGIEKDLELCCDAKAYFELALENLDQKKLKGYSKWITTCNKQRKKFPMVLKKYKKEKYVNSYYLTEVLSEAAAAKDTIVVDTSSAFHVVSQTWKIKRGQRFLTTGGISTMGYWASAIGACIARGKGRTIVVTGDGSFQMNLSEIATIVQYQLPIKIFVLNNNGYLLIRHTQKTHFGGRLMGESPNTGLWLPDSLKIAKAYGIEGISIDSTKGLESKIESALQGNRPVICDVKSPDWQLIIPRIASIKKKDGSMVSKPYEDLYPFLSKKQLESNMIRKKHR